MFNYHQELYIYIMIRVSKIIKFFQNTAKINMTTHIYKATTEISPIFAKEAFNLLDEREKWYAYYFSQASIEGAKTCLFHVSHQAPAIFTLIHLTFSGQTISELKERFLKISTQEAWTKLIVYCGAFLGQLGNFKSFSSQKFVPQATSDEFYTLLKLSNNYYSYNHIIDELWGQIKDTIYNLGPEFQKIGIFPNGVTGYYSNNLTREQIDLADQLLSILGVSELNTHIYKQGDVITIKVFSVNQSSKLHVFKGRKIILEYGFLGVFLNRINTNLKNCLPFVSNDFQKKMIQAYISHFQNGDIELHKESQRQWVKDKGPIVETNLGFIETYLDPKQVRAYYEGFVAVVNKKQSQVVGRLVENAENLLQKYIPWPKAFEKDTFLKPDFTSLSIVTFASYDTPRGINIPNYDDIRGEIGFKNVFLANHIIVPRKLPPYLNEVDGQHLVTYFNQISFHQVSYHELLGHGCGKLFTQKDGTFNCNIETTINPLTNEPIKSWYKEGETWSTKFKNLTNPYEQCRADSVALYYACFKEAVLLLQPQLPDWTIIRDGAFISFANMGINVLEFYDAKDKKWLQAHSNGRFVILQVLLEAGNDFIRIQKVIVEEKPSIRIHLDRSKIQSVGLPALKNFLLRLNVYKATADLEKATEMYQGYSAVNDYFLELKEIVDANKKQRSLQIKGNLSIRQNKLVYTQFDATFQGIISSTLANYPYFDIQLVNEWRNLQKYK